MHKKIATTGLGREGWQACSLIMEQNKGYLKKRVFLVLTSDKLAERQVTRLDRGYDDKFKNIF